MKTQQVEYTADCRILRMAYMVVILFTCFCAACAKRKVVKVGVMLESEDHEVYDTLRIVAEEFKSEIQLDLVIEKLTPGNSHEAAKSVCALMKQRVDVVLGPPSFLSSSRVQSICKWLHIPHIEMMEDFGKKKSGSSVNLAPHPRILSKAYAALIGQWKWYEEFAVIYEVPDDLFRIRDMLQFTTKRAYIFQLKTMTTKDEDLLKEIKIKGLTRIVLAVRLELILSYFEMAQEHRMTTEYYDYVIPNLDVATISFEDYHLNKVNITSFQLVDQTQGDYKILLRHLQHEGFNTTLEDMPVAKQRIKTEVALLYDAILFYGRVVSKLDFNGKDFNYPAPDCEYGSLYNPRNDVIIGKLKSSSFHGVTGLIKFDDDGMRTDFSINVIKLSYGVESGFRKIATWSEKHGYVPIVTENELQEASDNSTKDIVLKVTTVLGSPFFMKISKEDQVPNGPIYEGYVVDLMEEVSKVVNIRYIISPVKYSIYGSYHPERGTWNGMMGELVRKEADLAVSDLTITEHRQRFVDFTLPFMTFGIGMLFKEPAHAETSLFTFLKPLSLEVWIYMLTGYLCVSFLMFLLGRISPKEWTRPAPRNSNPHQLKTKFTLTNSLWWNIGALMQQGSDGFPKAVSTRMLAVIWWFFTLVMISYYTANLAAFLTAANVESPITNVEDLSRQSKVKYGTTYQGSTSNFFRSSQWEIYKKMWNFMKSAHPSVFTRSTAEGVARVKKGGYVFFMESTSIEYHVARDCELTQIGELLDTKSFGIATPKNSPHRSKLNEAIMKLEEQGILMDLKRRWWQVKERKCPESMELGLNHVGGVFVLLGASCVAALLIAALEFIWNVGKNIDDKAMFWRELLKQLKFSLSFGVSTKPVNKQNTIELRTLERKAMQIFQDLTDTVPPSSRNRRNSSP